VPQWIFWEPLAQAQLRKIDRTVAMQIFKSIERLKDGLGDVTPMVGYKPPAKRLKVGDYRVVFREQGSHFQIVEVGHRGEIYR